MKKLIAKYRAYVRCLSENEYETGIEVVNCSLESGEDFKNAYRSRRIKETAQEGDDEVVILTRTCKFSRHVE